MAVDAARGCAIVMMVVYHFLFDLNYFLPLGFDFYNGALWIGLRTIIISTFLGLVGVSLHLATRNGLSPRRFLRRLGLLVLCALLVTLGSAVAFPDSFIWFGVLHFIALASVLGLAMVRWYRANLWIGIALIVTGVLVSDPLFDHPALQWVGLMTHKPRTEDYVPLLPWFGIVLIGIFAGKWWFRDPRSGAAWRSGSGLPRALAFSGRHSLLIYMAHQPILFGGMYLLIGR